MDNYELQVFVSEVHSQAQMSVNAFNALSAISRKMAAQVLDPRADLEVMHAEHFRTIHSFLTHLSIVSRLLWPPSFTKLNCFCGKARAGGLTCGSCISLARANALQAELGLIGAEHVLKKRTLRDHLEHLDERLDEWSQSSLRKNFVQDYIGPEDGIVGLDAKDMMRQFNPATGDFTFRGEVFSLVDLVKGAVDIADRALKSKARLLQL